MLSEVVDPLYLYPYFMGQFELKLNVIGQCGSACSEHGVSVWVPFPLVNSDRGTLIGKPFSTKSDVFLHIV